MRAVSIGPGRGAVGDVRATMSMLLVAVLLALWMASSFARHPPDTVTLVGGTVGLAAVVALALLRFDLAVALGFLVFGIVRSEPAPPDAIFGVVIAIAITTGRFSLARVPMVVLSLLGAFIALNFLSAMEAVSTPAAGRFMFITLYLAVFAVWLTGYVDSVDRARLIVRTYVAGAIFWALTTSLALYLPLPGGAALSEHTGVRGTGLFEDPNVYGPFLIPAALIVVEEMMTPRLLRSAWPMKLLMFCVLATGVILSFSRAATISLIAAMLVMIAILAIRRGGGRRAMALLAVMAVGGGAVAAVLAVSGSITFLNERASLQTYDTQRFGAQAQGIRLAETHLLGVGPGQFDVLDTVSTHSIYVRVLAEQGILGLVVLVGLLLATLIFATRSAILGRDTYGVGSATLLGAWVALLINSFVVDTLHWRHLFFVAALIWAGSRRPHVGLDQADVSSSSTATGWGAAT